MTVTNTKQIIHIMMTIGALDSGLIKLEVTPAGGGKAGTLVRSILTAEDRQVLPQLIENF